MYQLILRHNNLHYKIHTYTVHYVFDFQVYNFEENCGHLNVLSQSSHQRLFTVSKEYKLGSALDSGAQYAG